MAKKKLDDTAAVSMLLETLADPGETNLACLKRIVRGSMGTPAMPATKSLLEDLDKAAAFAATSQYCNKHGFGHRGVCPDCEKEKHQ